MDIREIIGSEMVSAFCRKHHIRQLAVFGSFIRNDFTPESDIDILVQFDPEHIPGLAFFSMQSELSGILSRKVDLYTMAFLSPEIQEEVKNKAVIIYQDEHHRTNKQRQAKIPN